MTGLLQRVLCALGHHGEQHMHGARLPTRGSICYCIRCRAAWVAVHDGNDGFWERMPA
ncbi:MAG: hypothetical protein WKF96_00205 [Solirubrobacteraceae bacterium]